MTNDPSAAVAETRVRKFPCEQCGADLNWDPGASSLRCPYCGHVSEIPTSAEAVVERPIEEALKAKHDLGWGMERKAFHCTRCGSSTTFEPGQAAGACAFCGTPAVVEAPSDLKMVRPEGVLPFAVTEESAKGKFRHWLKSLWFRPSDLGKASFLTKMHGVYVPFWMFDASSQSSWTAEAGHYYYETVQVTRNGKTETKQERRVRWVPASGFVSMFHDDVLVIASRGLERNLAEAIEPYPTAELAAYDKAYLSGFIAEEYGIGVEDALQTAEQRMDSAIRAACVRQIPGDTHRNLVVRTRYSGVAYKNALLPIWIAAYQYGGKAYRYIVNGVTGKATGTAPWSWVKITLAVLAVIALIAIFLAIKGG
jgi:DNA-directed RNA polymerase subunit RPC12/RpoP